MGNFNHILDRSYEYNLGHTQKKLTEEERQNLLREYKWLISKGDVTYAEQMLFTQIAVIFFNYKEQHLIAGEYIGNLELRILFQEIKEDFEEE